MTEPPIEPKKEEKEDSLTPEDSEVLKRYEALQEENKNLKSKIELYKRMEIKAPVEEAKPKPVSDPEADVMRELDLIYGGK